MNIRFPGQYFDEETGLHYNYTRDYDPSTGRYLESDSVGLKGGLNTYGYAGQNPVMNVDPSGEGFLQVCELVIAIYVVFWTSREIYHGIVDCDPTDPNAWCYKPNPPPALPPGCKSEKTTLGNERPDGKGICTYPDGCWDAVCPVSQPSF